MTELGQGFDLYAHLSEKPGPNEVCPHCGAVTTIRDDEELRKVCRVCGGPRIPASEEAPMSPDALAALRRGEKARRDRAKGRALSIFGGIGIAAGALLALPVAIFSLTGALLTLAIVAGPSLAMLLFGKSRASGATKELSRAVDDAWIKAAQHLVERGVVKRPADLSRLLGIDMAKADELMTTLSVDAEIGAASGRVRIADDGSAPASIPVDPRFAELEKRLLETQKTQLGVDAEAEAAELEAALDAAKKNERAGER